MICQVRRWLPERALVFVADSTYATFKLLSACQKLPGELTLITRLRLDAARSDPVPARQPGQRGRTRKKGARQPRLAARLLDPTTQWSTVSVCWYGGKTRTVELASDTAVWFHAGQPPVAIRWVLVRDPEGKFATQALVSTRQELGASQMVEYCVQRWQLEVTVEEARAHLGSKHSASGRNWQYCEQHLSCWGCSR